VGNGVAVGVCVRAMGSGVGAAASAGAGAGNGVGGTAVGIGVGAAATKAGATGAIDATVSCQLGSEAVPAFWHATASMATPTTTPMVNFLVICIFILTASIAYAPAPLGWAMMFRCERTRLD